MTAPMCWLLALQCLVGAVFSAIALDVQCDTASGVTGNKLDAQNS
jgi:hypothetical protein